MTDQQVNRVQQSSRHFLYRAKGQSSLNAALGGIVCRGADNLFWNVAMNVPLKASLVYFLNNCFETQSPEKRVFKRITALLAVTGVM